MEKIYCKIPPNGLFYGLRQPFAKGTIVYCPEHHFGVARQGDGALKFFDEKITVNSKDIPGLKVPFLFGKVQGLDMYFYPYGFSGGFTRKDVVFTTKNGKKAKVSLKVSYKVEIESAYHALEINNKLMLNNPNKDGSLTRPNYFADDIVKYIVEKGDYAYSKIDMGSAWDIHFVEGESKRTSEMYTLTLNGKMSMDAMFKSFGYKPATSTLDTSVQILEFQIIS